MSGEEQIQTSTIMNIVDGYLEMLRADLRDARISGDLVLIAELEGVIRQLEGASEAREGINYGVEEELSNGREGQLNEEIDSINTEFRINREDYLDNIVASNIQVMNFLDEGDNMIVDYESELAIYPMGIVNLVTGMIILFSNINFSAGLCLLGNDGSI